MVDRRDRVPKPGADPGRRQVRTGGDPDSLDTETIAWQFHRLDKEHPLWGWDLPAKEWRLILAALMSLDTMTWAAIKSAGGGKGKGTNHHSIELAKFCGDAQRRLVELKLDDYDEIFSLRLNNTLRLYGVRDGRVLRLVWHDPHHGTASAAYILKK